MSFMVGFLVFVWVTTTLAAWALGFRTGHLIGTCEGLRKAREILDKTHSVESTLYALAVPGPRSEQ